MRPNIGQWLIKPEHMPDAAVSDKRRERESRTLADSVAVVSIAGTLSKSGGWYGTSTVEAISEIRKAAANDKIETIILSVSSPGGTVAGTEELGRAVAQAKEIKPVIAYVDDMAASAAYWVASQASKIYAGKTSVVGSIGVVSVVADTSEYYKELGIKVIVMSTGEHKGAFIDGAPVEEAHIQEHMDLSMKLHDYFVQAIMEGRDMTREQVDAVADGRVFLAEDALELGLIDGVKYLDEIVAGIAAGKRRGRLADAGKVLQALESEHSEQ